MFSNKKDLCELTLPFIIMVLCITLYINVASAIQPTASDTPTGLNNDLIVITATP